MKQVNKNLEQRRYGFLSIMALVVGSVIGSGIFFKNDSVNQTTQSGFISLLGWLIIASVVMMIAVAMLELFSAKTKNRRAGVAGISSTFISPSWGKFIGFFFVYAYFPSSLAAVAVYSGSLLMDAIVGASGSEALTNMMAYPWIELAVTTTIGVAIIGFVGLMNTFTEKPGKWFQSFGTGFQLIPLVLIMFLVIFLFAAPSLFGPATSEGAAPMPVPGVPVYEVPFVPSGGMPETFNLDSTVNGGYYINEAGEVVAYGMEQGANGIVRVLVLALPPIMFTFDGFLFASSLQAEAKSRKTFPVALVTGIIVISILYLFIAIGTIETASVPPLFMPGENVLTPNADGSYNLVAVDGLTYNVYLTPGEIEYLNSTSNQAIVLNQHLDWWAMGGVAGLTARLFPQAAAWLPDLVAFIIVISTLTTVSGFFIASARDMSILSSEDLIADSDGKYLRRNKAGVPQNSSLVVLGMTLIWLVLAKSMDAIFIADQMNGWTQAAIPAAEVYTTAATDFVADFIVVLAFAAYVLPLIGGIINRFTKKVETEQSKLFIPFATIASLVTLFIVVTNILSVFAGVADDPMDWIKVGLLIVTLAVPAYLNWRAGVKVKNTTSSEWRTKQLYKEAYFALQTVEEYEAQKYSNLDTKEFRVPKAKPNTKKTEVKTVKPVEEKVTVKKSAWSNMTDKTKDIYSNTVSKVTKTSKEQPKETVNKKTPAQKAKDTKKFKTDLDKLTVTELKELAKKQKLTGYSKLNKQELINLIVKAK